MSKSKYGPLILFALLAATLLARHPVRGQEADHADAVTKTVCQTAQPDDTLDGMKAKLLVEAKKEAANELYGELILAHVRVEDSIVTDEVLQLFVEGVVRIDGTPQVSQGSRANELCLTVDAYAAQADRALFEPMTLTGHSCIAEEDVTIRQLRAKALKQAKISLLHTYDPRLQDVGDADVIMLLRNVEMIKDGFEEGGARYCVDINAGILPIEVRSLIAFGDGAAEPSMGSDESAPTKSDSQPRVGATIPPRLTPVATSTPVAPTPSSTRPRLGATIPPRLTPYATAVLREPSDTIEAGDTTASIRAEAPTETLAAARKSTPTPTATVAQRGLLQIATIAANSTPYLVIESGTAILREGPGMAYAPISPLGPNIPMKILGRDPSGVWYQVCCVNQIPVWVSSADAPGLRGFVSVPLVMVKPPTQTPTSLAGQPAQQTPTPTSTLESAAVAVASLTPSSTDPAVEPLTATPQVTPTLASTVTPTPTVALSPAADSPLTLTPASTTSAGRYIPRAQVRRPSDAEIVNVPEIWDLVVFEELTTPATHTYQATIQEESPWRWGYNWCSSDKATLRRNLPLDITFLVDGQYVWPVNIKTRRIESNGWFCKRWSTLVTNWPTDHDTELVIEYALPMPVFDGVRTLTAGTYTHVLEVTNLGGVSANSSSPPIDPVDEFSPIDFCTEDEYDAVNEQCMNTRAEFTSPVTKLYASWTPSQAFVNASLTSFWHIDGIEQLTSEIPEQYTLLRSSSADGLKPGRYTIDLFSEDVFVQSGEFTILPTATGDTVPDAPAQAESTPDSLRCIRPSEDYTRVQVNNQELTARTLSMLELANSLYEGRGDPLRVVQGSYTDVVEASFGTHAGGGAVDVSIRVKDNPQLVMSIDEAEEMVMAMRYAGFAAWLRLPEDLDPPTTLHIHAIAIGDRDLADAALLQLDGPGGYFRGYDGVPAEYGGPTLDRLGGPVVCEWMADFGYSDLR